MNTKTEQVMLAPASIKDDTGASLFEWWQAGFVPIILAWIAYKSLKAQVDSRNRKRRKEEPEREFSDETIMEYLKDKVGKK